MRNCVVGQNNLALAHCVTMRSKRKRAHFRCLAIEFLLHFGRQIHLACGHGDQCLARALEIVHMPHRCELSRALNRNGIRVNSRFVRIRHASPCRTCSARAQRECRQHQAYEWSGFHYGYRNLQSAIRFGAPKTNRTSDLPLMSFRVYGITNFYGNVRTFTFPMKKPILALWSYSEALPIFTKILAPA